MIVDKDQFDSWVQSQQNITTESVDTPAAIMTLYKVNGEIKALAATPVSGGDTVYEVK